MDKFPLLMDGKPTGELTAEREGLYTWFSARCPLRPDGLWCAWAVGDRGELRLGVLEPEGPIQVDDLIESTGIPARRVSSALTMLEIDGCVRQHDGKRYTRTVALTE